MGAHARVSDGQRRSRWITYTATGLLVVVVLIIMAIMWGTRTANATATAQSKAKQLNEQLVAAGLSPVDPDVLTKALGTKGGQLCADPAGTVAKVAALTTGAAGPGQRPVIAPQRLIEGAGLVVKVYCPDKQEQFAQALAGLHLEG
ncbi:hypothetical protein [Nonomuraea endophytica]|uniref:Uncharacterized protein n=1 Tax=Nonomuraea endophytica TaxID=714136 RepID=A0A7W8AEU6_9ACTN|nr:hypothetical protein [Nonomuraea endophytica]MBB5083781.1 hypothetical protein [Nonomuraea endophytica]